MRDLGMTNDPYIPPEAKVYEAFLRWLEEGKRVWGLFDQEGVPVPETLKIALTDPTKTGSNSHQFRPARLRAPERPAPPPGAGYDWIWIDAKEAMLRTVVLAILHEGITISVKDLTTRVKKILPDTNEGSIGNIGTYLDGKQISRTEKGWTLKEGVEAPVLYEGYIWAPPALLTKQDLAAFRRMAIRHLLGISPDGLQVMQVYRQLKSADWLKTPLSKDLVKADLFVMQDEKKVKRFGSQRKWTLRENG